MGFSIKILAKSDEVASLGDGSGGFPGLGAIACEDPWFDVYQVWAQTRPGSAQTVFDTGARTPEQLQLQDANSNTNPGTYHVAVVPVLPPSGFMIDRKNVVCHIGAAVAEPYMPEIPTDVRFVVVGATLPAVDGSFALEINNAGGYSVDDVVHVEGAGECTITGITDNVLTLDYDGVPRAIVTIAA